MRIRLAKEEDISQVKNMWQCIFKDTAAFAEYYFEEKIKDNEMMLLEHANEQAIIAMLHLNPFDLQIKKYKEKIAYIVGVATRPEDERKGYMRKLMEAALLELYDWKHPLCILMPVDDRIYTRFGFEFILEQYEVNLNAQDLPTIASQIKVAICGDSGLEELTRYYQQQMKQQFETYISRDLYAFKRLYKEIKSESGTIITFRNQSQIVGYMMLYNHDNLCEVREMLYDDIDVLQTMFSYLHHFSKANQVKLRAHRQEIYYLLPHSTQISRVTKPWMMGRIIHLHKFMRLFKQIGQGQVDLEIIDPVIAANNGVFRWDLEEGVFQPSLEEPEVVLDIGTLLQWLYGHRSFDTLIRMKKIKLTNDRHYDKLRAVQTMGESYINEIV